MATVNDIEGVYKGEDLMFDWIMDPVEDINGWTMKFTVRHYAHVVGTPLLQIDVTVVPPSSNGQLRVIIPSASCLTLGVGDFDYDVQRTDVGFVTVLSIGKLTVSQEVRTP